MGKGYHFREFISNEKEKEEKMKGTLKSIGAFTLGLCFMFGTTLSHGAEPIKIAGIFALKGPAAHIGTSQKNAVMIAFDEVFPHVRTYYEEVPDFLQTLEYVGPGMGLLIQIEDSLSDVTIEYPAE